ncbi:hypothetical protein NM208_g17058 [Fusarium decemcellulare]|uniref:Uncharacterized protein n=1 Tax=Fusarium decemcellulare TaxID=57161 RepID=A0ACC1R8H4_9HYPO|nr:hypothetical protein NM208_g17058 [Fusarium decemcellulare]
MESYAQGPKAVIEQAFDRLGKIIFGLALLAREAPSKDIEDTTFAIANAAIQIKEIQSSILPIAEEARSQRRVAKASLWGGIGRSYPRWSPDRRVVDEFIERYQVQEIAKDPSLCNANWVAAPRDLYARDKRRGPDDLLFATRPRAQFQSQFARECERLVYQKAGERVSGGRIGVPPGAPAAVRW